MKFGRWVTFLRKPPWTSCSRNCLMRLGDLGALGKVEGDLGALGKVKWAYLKGTGREAEQSYSYVPRVTYRIFLKKKYAQIFTSYGIILYVYLTLLNWVVEKDVSQIFWSSARTPAPPDEYFLVSWETSSFQTCFLFIITLPVVSNLLIDIFI
jgi:hypothetical protein